MGILDIVNGVMDVILGWSLPLDPFLAIFLISFILSLIITLCYKWMTDQNLMKQLKDEMKEFQKEIKELKNNPEKAMTVQKKAMETNMKYMGKSLKPTLITFIPIIIIFGWLSAHFAYEPLMPGQEFTIDMNFEKGVVDGEASITVPEGITLISDPVQKIGASKSSWVMKGIEGDYFVTYTFQNRTFSNKVLITEERKYHEAVTPMEDVQVANLQIEYPKLIVMNLFGWRLGWLGTYIIFSIIFSLGLRKAMKLY